MWWKTKIEFKKDVELGKGNIYNEYYYTTINGCTVSDSMFLNDEKSALEFFNKVVELGGSVKKKTTIKTVEI